MQAAPDGRQYFFHPATGTTQWDRPTGPPSTVPNPYGGGSGGAPSTIQMSWA